MLVYWTPREDFGFYLDVLFFAASFTLLSGEAKFCLSRDDTTSEKSFQGR